MSLNLANSVKTFREDSNEFIEYDDKKLQSKGFDPRISSVDGESACNYAKEPSVIAISFKLSLANASLLLSNMLNSVN